jgi:hypothetical protein
MADKVLGGGIGRKLYLIDRYNDKWLTKFRVVK